MVKSSGHDCSHSQSICLVPLTPNDTPDMAHQAGTYL